MTESTGARPDGHSNGRATKQTIVERAAQAFSEQGFYGASMRGIARAAGVDHSTLLHHFRTKDKLLLAVLEWQDEQHEAASSFIESTEAELVDVAEELVHGFMKTAEHNRSVPGLIQLLSVVTAEAGTATHPARGTLQARHTKLRGLLARTIRARRQAGLAVDDGLTPDESAALVIATWEGLESYDALHPGEVDVPQLLGRTLRQAFGLPL